MRSGWVQKVSIAFALGVCAVTMVPAQQGGGAGRGQGRGGGAVPAQTPAVRQIPRSPVVDQAAHDRGRAIWASDCVDCHGGAGTGSDTGPNIIRTKTVNFDRISPSSRAAFSGRS